MTTQRNMTQEDFDALRRLARDVVWFAHKQIADYALKNQHLFKDKAHAEIFVKAVLEEGEA